MSLVIDGQRTLDVAGYVLQYENLCSGKDIGAPNKTTDDMTLNIENRYFSATVDIKATTEGAQESKDLLNNGGVEAYVLVVTAKTANLEAKTKGDVKLIEHAGATAEEVDVPIRVILVAADKDTSLSDEGREYVDQLPLVYF